MDNHTLVRPTLDDAKDIHELVSAADVAAIGVPDATLDDVVDQLSEPGFDPGTDSWLARDAAGTLVGFTWACGKAGIDAVDVEVYVRPGVDGLADRLWTLVLRRASEIGARGGHREVTVHAGIHRQDTAKRAVAQAHGFAPATSFHRMRIDFDGPVEAPPGLTLHAATTDEVRRTAYLIHQEAFADHFGFVSVDYDRWFASRDAASVHDWQDGLVARVDGEPAGVMIANNMFVPDENCGYVETLGVRPKFRGSGLGRFLLRTAFAADAARGRKGTILHVDTNNVTPALGLYTSAGMREVMVIDIWRRRI